MSAVVAAETPGRPRPPGDALVRGRHRARRRRAPRRSAGPLLGRARGRPRRRRRAERPGAVWLDRPAPRGRSPAHRVRPARSRPALRRVGHRLGDRRGPDAGGRRRSPPSRPRPAAQGVRRLVGRPRHAGSRPDLRGPLFVRGPGLGGQATTIDAVEHYFSDGAIFVEDRVLAVILEATPEKLDAAEADFERFAVELASRAGTAAAPRHDRSSRSAAARRSPRSATRTPGRRRRPPRTPTSCGRPSRS